MRGVWLQMEYNVSASVHQRAAGSALAWPVPEEEHAEARDGEYDDACDDGERPVHHEQRAPEERRNHATTACAHCGQDGKKRQRIGDRLTF